MAHLTVRGDPCGLSDGHYGCHRTIEGAAAYREAIRAHSIEYNKSEAGRARSERYRNTPKGREAHRRAQQRSVNRDPVGRALVLVKHNAKRRGGGS